MSRAVEDATGIDVSDHSAADEALREQRRAGNRSIALQREQFDQAREDLNPYREIGGGRLKDLAGDDFQRDFTMGDFQKDPGYNFRMQEGMKALEGSAAARGSLNSGATLKALSRYGQDFASNEYNNAYNRFNADRDRRYGRLLDLANVGLQASGQQINAGQNYANQAGSTMIGMGNAAASKYLGQADQFRQAVQGGAQGAAQAYYSDCRLKTNIEPVGQEEIKELKAAIKPYRFNYVSKEFGQGDWVGVMAQDLEKTKLGKTVVEKDERGLRKVNLGKLLSLLVAAEAS